MKRILIALLLAVVSIVTIQAQNDRQLIREGNQLYRQGHYAQAETTYRKALNQNPNSVRATYNLGCALMKQGKVEEADKQFTHAGTSNAEKELRSKAYYNKGVMYHDKKDYAKAIDAYKNALRLNPKDENARKNLALCKRQQQQQQNQKQQNQQNNNQQNQDKDQQQQDKNQQNKDNKQNDNQDKKQPSKPQDEMSKENAEQLLNAVMQEEKETQQRLKKAMQQPANRNLDKNW